MRVDRATLWLFAILLLAAVWRFSAALPGRVGVRLDRLQPTECWFEIPKGRVARCGYLEVPDHRDRGVTTNSHLAIAVFSPAVGATRSDPVLFLSGGPGGAFGFGDGKGWWWSWIDTVALQHGREFVAMDQRGVGRSWPRVDCPGLRVLEKRLLERDVHPDDEDRQWIEAIGMCRDRLLSEGVDLSIFGSAQSAADIETLRRALGVEQWNLYGISYGTRLALTVARDHPAGVRSLVLDSVYPLEVQTLVEGPGGLDFAFRMMWLPCESDPECAAAHPAMRESLERVVAKLNERPVTVRFVHPDTLEKHLVVLDGDRLIDALIVGLSGHADLKELAATIDGIDRGKSGAAEGLVRDYWTAMQDEDFSYPVNFSVECREEVAFNDRDSARRAAGLYPLVARHERRDTEMMERVCDLWGEVPAGLREREPVRSEIPALILAGVFDPVTPASWAERTVQHLPNGHLLKFIAGHSVTDADPCALRLIAAFLYDPSKRPEADCYPRQSGAPLAAP